MSARKEALILAGLLIFFGMVALAVSMGYVERVPGAHVRRRAEFPAPRWIVACAGLAFVSGGIAALLTGYHRVRAANLAAALAGTLVATVLAWFVIAKMAA